MTFGTHDVELFDLDLLFNNNVTRQEYEELKVSNSETIKSKSECEVTNDVDMLDLGLLFDEDVSLQPKDLKVTHSEVIESKAMSLSHIETNASQSVCKDVVDLNYVNLRVVCVERLGNSNDDHSLTGA